MTKSWPEPSHVFEYYLRMREGLSALRASVSGPPETVDPRSRFRNMTAVELNAAFREAEQELEQQVVLLLTASAEAAVRTDFLLRVKRRGKDHVSKRFTALEQQRKARGKPGVKLELILDAWKREVPPTAGQAIDRLQKLLVYRHWLAHGRWWVEKRSGLYHPDAYEAWGILRSVLNKLPGFPGMPEW